MRRIAGKAGASTDTLHDYVYTDWVGLDKFVNDLVAEIRKVVISEPKAGGHSPIPSLERKARHA
jgi:hypothetical protein